MITVAPIPPFSSFTPVTAVVIPVVTVAVIGSIVHTGRIIAAGAIARIIDASAQNP
jgi:2-keto-4-pentenoate hydratase